VVVPVDLAEHRQITSGVGIANFVAGMAVWPAGITAHPMNWIHWAIGVGVALLGVYVFTAAFSDPLPLPGRKAALKASGNRYLAHGMLALMRVRGMQLHLGRGAATTPEDYATWAGDVCAFVGDAWGVKQLSTLAPPYGGQNTLESNAVELMERLDRFIARCDTVPLEPDFELRPEFQERYLDNGPASAANPSLSQDPADRR
jgi:hypothetical protein